MRPAALAALCLIAPLAGAGEAPHPPLPQMAAYCALPTTLPAECLPDPTERAGWSPTLMGKLAMAKAEADRRIVATPDAPGADLWRYVGPGGGPGDCDDYAMTSRRLLVRMGVPAGAVRMLVVLTPWAERHLVLEVRTDRGAYVLDNLAPVAYPRAAMPHSPELLSGADPLGPWARVGAGAPQVRSR